MSERAPMTDLPLFAPDRAPEPVPAVHTAAELEHAAFFDRVRRILGNMYGGTDRAISTDEAWKVMELYGIKLPAGASPNLLGTLFSGWKRARATDKVIRSKRFGAGGNMLRTWLIV